MSAIDDFLADNETYAKGCAKGTLPMPPAKQIAVVACMDARLETGVLLGLKEGDAHVIRKAGGVQESSFFPRRDQLRGFVYEVETGSLREVT